MALVTGTSTAAATVGSTAFGTAQLDPASTVLRWEDGEWKAYRTMPQRALDGQLAFEIYDGTKVYDYFAKVLGLVALQFMRDAKDVVERLADPRRVPSDRLDLLLSTFGGLPDEEQTEAQRREMLRVQVPWMKEKGTPESIVTALSLLGYQGYATQVWVDPTVIPAADAGFILRPLSWVDTVVDSTYEPSSGLAIHLRFRDGTQGVILPFEEQQRIAKFLKETVLPAHTFIRLFVTEDWDNEASRDIVHPTEATLWSAISVIEWGEAVVASSVASVTIEGSVV